VAKQGQIDRLAQKAQAEMDASTTRLSKVLQGELSTDDAQNVPTDAWHQMIRDNWNDPAWRQAQAQRVGAVSLVQDAMKAHGLDPKLLEQHPAAMGLNPASAPLVNPEMQG
jgi:hypothetical protein